MDISQLTGAQRNAIKIAVLANPTAAAARTAGDVVALLNWLNGPSAALAWRSAVSPQVSDEGPSYTLFDNLIAGKRDSWKIFLGFTRDYTRIKIRNWVADVWGLNTTGGNTEATLTSAGTEFATNAQNAIGGTTPSTVGAAYVGTSTLTALKRDVSEQMDMTVDNWLNNN